MSSSCLIIVGEKSGEEHARSFFPQIKEQTPGVSYFGVGGEELSKQGVELLYPLEEFSSFGIGEVLGKIPFYIQAMNRVLAEVDKRKTKVAILVDFQTFNLILAGKLKKRGVKVLYYVAPQAWAWKEWRVRPLEENIHILFALFPFEKKWFQERGVKSVVSVRHPLVNEDLKVANRKGRPTLLLLPGSRKSEVSQLLPVFSKVAKIIQDEFGVQVSIVKSKSVKSSMFAPYEKIFDKVYESNDLNLALEEAHWSLSSSGTVTLSLGLAQVPTIVCYKVSLFSQFLFENFINYSGYISLTNLMCEEEIYPELTQDRVSVYNILKILRLWINNEEECLKHQSSKVRDYLTGEMEGGHQLMVPVIREACGII